MSTESMSTELSVNDKLTNKYRHCSIKLVPYISEGFGKDEVMITVNGVNSHVTLHQVSAAELRSVAYICKQMADLIDPTTGTN